MSVQRTVHALAFDIPADYQGPSTLVVVLLENPPTSGAPLPHTFVGAVGRSGTVTVLLQDDVLPPAGALQPDGTPFEKTLPSGEDNQETTNDYSGKPQSQQLGWMLATILLVCALLGTLLVCTYAKGCLLWRLRQRVCPMRPSMLSFCGVHNQ